MSNSEYGSSNIKVLKGLEAVRKRPGMYIGDTNTGGLHHMVYEVVDNSVDESLAGHCNYIKVVLNSVQKLNPDGTPVVENGEIVMEDYIEVTDNGRGIPVDIHPTENIPTVTVVLTVLHAGGKFDKDTYKVSGGLHGVGVSVVNALSDYLEVRVKRDGKEYKQTFSKGIPTSSLEVVGNTKERGTTVIFKADPEIMEVTHFNADVLRRRFKEMAFLNKNITIEFVDNKNNKRDVFHFEGGLVEYVLDVNKKSLVTNVIPINIQENNLEGEIALAYNEGYEEKVLSFVNNIRTPDGGTHEAGFKMGLSNAITSYLSKNGGAREKDVKLTGEDVREGLVAIVSVKIPEPQFEGQTKSKLGSSYVRGIVQKLTYEKLSKFFEENPLQAKAIVAKALLAAKGREAAKRARDLARSVEKSSVGSLPGKLADCQWKEPEKCELYLVEGDSAGGSAKQGRDRHYQAILPLKGKILNVEKSMLDKILKSEEVKNIITAIGTGIGNDFKFETCRYHKIIIMTDADVDGSHIQTLLLTFFYRYFRPLIESGFIYLALPPLYRFEKKGRFGGVVYLRDEQALDRHLIRIGVQEVSLSQDKENYPFLIKDIDTTVKVLDEVREFNKILKNIYKLIPSKELIEVLLKAVSTKPLTPEEAFKVIENFSNNYDVFKTEFKGKTITAKPYNIIGKEKIGESISLRIQIPKGLIEIYLTPEMFSENSYFGLCGKILKDFNKYDFKHYTPFTYLDAFYDVAKRGSHIQRYKGLGEMNPDQLWETAMNPDNRILQRIVIKDYDASDSVFNLFMGSEVEPRRQYIMENADKVKNLDV